MLHFNEHLRDSTQGLTQKKRLLLTALNKPKLKLQGKNGTVSRVITLNKAAIYDTKQEIKICDLLVISLLFDMN